MLKIRLRRMGKKKAPTYRIVVADAASPRDGRFVEEIGIYDPNPDKAYVRIDAEAAAKWLSCGAKPTAIVEKLFKAEGIGKDAAPAKKEAADKKAAVKKEEPAKEEAKAKAEAPAEAAEGKEAEVEAAEGKEAEVEATESEEAAK